MAASVFPPPTTTPLPSPSPETSRQPQTAAVSGGACRVAEMRDAVLDSRFQRHWPTVVRQLEQVYGPAATPLLDRLRNSVNNAVAARSDELWLLDLQREVNPEWFQSPKALGYVCYTDRFAGTLQGLRSRINYLEELGITYLHLMPLLQPREGENDGGYAVAAYDKVDDRIGSMEDLAGLASDLHARDMSLCVDLVVNHTAKEHSWAVGALNGDPAYENFYFFFPDRIRPDAYERTLREVFPAFAPGNFTWQPDQETWVWTTFNEFQWDLNYANPRVFEAMFDVMLNLAAHGVDVLRLDAVPFMWKRLGTDCENQPEVHAMTTAWRALMAIAAPAMLFKSEAIVPPEDLRSYLGVGDPERHEADLAYNNQLMVLLWSSLATREARLMSNALGRFGDIPEHAAWATYVRCHDDIGWAVTDQDAGSMGWSGFGHRSFLNDFYSGRFTGSFAMGARFQENLLTGDARISGTAASLCGVEKALLEHDPVALDAALARLELAYAITFAFGGTPLLYMGDELALRNDHAFASDPTHAADNRWLHRPLMDWDAAELRNMPGTLEHRVFNAMTDLIHARGNRPELHGAARITIHWLADHRLFCFERRHRRGDPFWMVANFGDEPIRVEPWTLPTWQGRKHRSVLRGNGADLDAHGWMLPPRGYLWLVNE
jgi:amylosucrase